MKENDELTHRVVKGIEEDIVSSFSLNSFDYDKDKCLLSLRSNIINEMVLSHQEDIIDAIREFNDSLREALREMYERAHSIWDKMINTVDDTKVIKLEVYNMDFSQLLLTIE